MPLAHSFNKIYSELINDAQFARQSGKIYDSILEYNSGLIRASLVDQMAKNLPAMQETWVLSLGWEDPLRGERLPTPIFCPGDFHRLYSSWGRKELDMTERLSLSLLHWQADSLPLSLQGSPLMMILQVFFISEGRPFK